MKEVKIILGNGNVIFCEETEVKEKISELREDGIYVQSVLYETE